MTKRICPECHKDVDPEAPLCQCGNQIVPPASRWRIVIRVGGVLLAALALAMLLDIL